LFDGRLAGEAFNFSGDARRTVLEIVADLQRLTGRTDLVPDIRNSARAEIREQWLSSDKAHRELGWRAAYTLEQGLAETLTWYRAWLGEAARA
jgi:nucleoside-diphosphate-sugar epimerase